MALIPRKPLDPLDPFEPLDYWDCLRKWRALDFFDTMLPSFFHPLYPIKLHSISRSKSLTHLNYGNDIDTTDGFQAQLDVHHFKPSEIEVRIINDVVVIEGKQEHHWDETRVTKKSFTHRYSLPIGYDPWQVQATLTPSGILTITCPQPVRKSIKCVKRYIPIKHL